jgi:hypothetical protein
MSVDRRTFLSRLAGAAASVLGALGLSCGPETPPDEWEQAWWTLKRVWQEMTHHATGQVRNERAFERLEPQMQAALTELKEQAAALQVQPGVVEALQAVAEWRYTHIQASVYPFVTCYLPTPLGSAVASSQARLEKQYAILARLAAQGRIKPEVADKAQQLIGRQVEFQSQAHHLWEENAPYLQQEELAQAIDWETGEVKPDFAVSEQSQQVARLILELYGP